MELRGERERSPELALPRYSCSRAWMDNSGPHCIAFGGLRVDDAIEEALLGVVGPGAIAAATAAAKEAGERRDQVRDALSRDLEAARYAADRPSGNTMPLTPRTGWWRASWKRAGTGRLSTSQRLRANLPRMTTRRTLPPWTCSLFQTIGFDLLYAFVIVRHDRRNLVWINVSKSDGRVDYVSINRSFSVE
jgi:hypothetical protein